MLFELASCFLKILLFRAKMAIVDWSICFSSFTAGHSGDEYRHFINSWFVSELELPVPFASPSPPTDIPLIASGTRSESSTISKTGDRHQRSVARTKSDSESSDNLGHVFPEHSPPEPSGKGEAGPLMNQRYRTLLLTLQWAFYLACSAGFINICVDIETLILLWEETTDF